MSRDDPEYIPHLKRYEIPDEQMPWWALPMLDLPTGSVLSRVRSHIMQGIRPAREMEWAGDWYEAYHALFKMAYTIASSNGLEEWHQQMEWEINQDRERAAHWAHKSGPRGWVQWADLRDDNGERMLLKDFHVRVIQAVRTISLVEVLLPFMHGKSALVSGVVPLIDWSEEAESTQIRVYAAEDFATGWARTLMNTVEHHERLHRLFPAIQRPPRGNPNYKIWSTDGFNIAGRTLVTKEPSFRPITWQAGRVGIRGDRIVFDDLVNDENDDSIKMQDRMWDYLKSSGLTMRTRRPWISKYGTKWGTTAVVGTIFHKQDVNSRAQREWRGKPDRKVIRIDVFPYKGAEEDGVVIWPEVRPYSYIMQLKEELGERAFRMRLRNQPQGDDGSFGFDEETIKAAVRPEWNYGTVPAGAPCIVGFDPASSKLSRWVKFPSFVVLAFRGDMVHFVAWGRWRGKTFPAQIGELAQLGMYYQCPVVIEDNNVQIGYKEQMEETYPSVKVLCMTTGDNKRDPVSGVETFDPLFRNHKIIIHAGNAPKDMLNGLVKEYSDWPQGEYSDLVMAAWIAKRQYDLLHKFHGAKVQESPVPEYVRHRGLSTSIDLRPYKEAVHGGHMPWQQ